VVKLKNILNYLRKSLEFITVIVIIAFIVLLISFWGLVLFAGSMDDQKESDGYLSPSTLATDEEGGTIYVAAETGKQIIKFDTTGSKVAGVIHVPEAPTGLALSADGSYLYITGSKPKGSVYVFDLAEDEICFSIPA
jgi:hypothetical protein